MPDWRLWGWPTPHQSRRILGDGPLSTHGGPAILRRRPRRSSTVSSKLILPLAAGFALCVAGSATARAESTSPDPAASQTKDPQTTDSQTTPTKKKKMKKAESEKKHPNKTALDKAERGNPHSTIYKSRKNKSPNPTNEQLQAGESGNTDSVDYGKRESSKRSPTNAEINAGETGNPASVDYGKNPKEGEEK